MDLNALLGPSLDANVEKEVAPIRRRLMHVGGLAASYLDEATEAARHRAVGVLLQQIGQAHTPVASHVARDALTVAIRELLREIGGEPVILAASPQPRLQTPRNERSWPASLDYQVPSKNEPRRVPPPLKEAPAVAAPVVAPKPVQAPVAPVAAPAQKTSLKPLYALKDEVGRLHAGAYMAKVGRLHAGAYMAMPPLRLSLLVQAIAAEIRIGLVTLPADHSFIGVLRGCLKFLAQVCHDRLDGKLVRGLEDADTANWSEIARLHRRRVDKFDRDAALERAKTPTPSPVSPEPPLQVVASPEPSPASVPEPPPEWPALRAVLSQGSVLVVGNVKKVRERAEWVKTRLGVEPNWFVIDNDKAAPRAVENVAARIESSTSVKGVIILEGFVQHKVTNRIEEACVYARIPYAFGGRGGNGEIRGALHELNRRLACLEAFGSEGVRAVQTGGVS
jgi:hypothetical protein